MSTIAVAVSGGVDSLVAAHRLKALGSRVFGIHFSTGFEPGSSAPRRHSPDVSDLSDQLEMDIHVVDLAVAFREGVVDYFIDAYLKGLTPNPCLVCNPRIKFGVLLNHAVRLGADRLATGHYARIVHEAKGPPRLFRGIDRAKDQSYFLSRLTPDQLSMAMFPLGDFLKADVRRFASDKGLRPAAREESQDVCFIQDGSYGPFIETHGRSLTGPGDIVDTEGRIVGRHRGLHLYTVGQRRGIGCPASAPYYVVRIDTVLNRLVVGFKDRLNATECGVDDINWIRKPKGFPATVSVQLRYRHQPVPAVLTPAGRDTLTVRFAAAQQAVTPGQGAVFFDQEEVLGGGWILPPS
jgi:tRNA-specific 2-thiouridylase